MLSTPFVDLGPSCRPLNEAILADIAELLDSGRFHYGPQVTEFEECFAAYCGVSRCVGMSSGLDALRLALLAAGIEPGDEVIVPANTFIATFAAVRQAGGVPVPVDASDEDYNVDPALFELVSDEYLHARTSSVAELQELPYFKRPLLGTSSAVHAVPQAPFTPHLRSCV